MSRCCTNIRGNIMEMQNSFLEENAPPISQFEIIVLKDYLIDERGNEIFKNAKMASGR